MFAIILFIYFHTIFIHKKWFRCTVPRDWCGNHHFSWHLICGYKQVLIWNIRFHFPCTRSFCKLAGTSRVKFFLSCHTVFSIIRVLRSNFSPNAMAQVYLLLRHPSFILEGFTLLNWQKFLLFIILLVDKRLIPVCSVILRGTRCVSRACSYKQISSSIKLVFSSVVTDLGRPELSFLFMVPLSLNASKILLWMCKSSFSIYGLSKFYMQTTPFFHNHFEWRICLLLKTSLWTDSEKKILWAKKQILNNI